MFFIGFAFVFKSKRRIINAKIPRLKETSMSEKHHKALSMRSKNTIDLGLEEKWKIFKDCVIEAARENCGVKRIGNDDRRKST